MAIRILCALALATITLGCGAERRGHPEGPTTMKVALEHHRGATMFHRFCYQCHPGGESGLGPALNDKPLPAFGMRTQIRVGVGAMPSFPPEQLSDDDVDAIIEYVIALRREPVTYEEARND